MSDEIYVRDGEVQIRIAGYDGDPESCTPAEARQYAIQLIRAARECEQQAERIRAACADGHHWNTGTNSSVWGNNGRTKAVTTQYCRRPGCRARRDLDGWMQYAEQLHIDPVTRVRITCTGPGCDTCDMERLGRAIRQTITDGLARLTATPTEGGGDERA